MIEDSVEGFIARWRAYAASGTAFGRAEGSPLLEVAIGNTIVQTLERTGPYGAPTGPIRFILHAMTDALTPAESEQRSLTAVGLGRLELTGIVVARDGPVTVVDAGAKVVVGVDDGRDGGYDVLDEDVDGPEVGAWVTCTSFAPLHAFVLPPERARSAVPPPDDQV